MQESQLLQSPLEVLIPAQFQTVAAFGAGDGITMGSLESTTQSISLVQLSSRLEQVRIFKLDYGTERGMDYVYVIDGLFNVRPLSQGEFSKCVAGFSTKLILKF